MVATLQSGADVLERMDSCRSGTMFIPAWGFLPTPSAVG